MNNQYLQGGALELYKQRNTRNMVERAIVIGTKLGNKFDNYIHYLEHVWLDNPMIMDFLQQVAFVLASSSASIERVFSFFHRQTSYFLRVYVIHISQQFVEILKSKSCIQNYWTQYKVNQDSKLLAMSIFWWTAHYLGVYGVKWQFYRHFPDTFISWSEIQYFINIQLLEFIQIVEQYRESL
ncbi:Hypothetical_protein [Hexamita inflata]|uniref:Hypothetical_protein n=1 Tax=Hexamita inflata TaxID=28002 RepID=A0AA86S093_9EUKA|nr:Hypothetical protein HINF_LOCUS63430 [Hexamita inflata]